MVSINYYMFRLFSAIFRKPVRTSPTFQCRWWSPLLSSSLNMMYFTHSIWSRSLQFTTIEADIVYDISCCKLCSFGFTAWWICVLLSELLLLNILNQGLMYLKKKDMTQRNKKGLAKEPGDKNCVWILRIAQLGLCIEGHFLQNNSLRN